MRSDILFLCVSVCWGRLEAEPEDRIRDRCCGVPVTASFTRQQITEVSQDLGKTTALLATSNVDKAISVFQKRFCLCTAEGHERLLWFFHGQPEKCKSV